MSSNDRLAPRTFSAVRSPDHRFPTGAVHLNGGNELVDPADVATKKLAKLLRAFGAARARRHMTSDEALIFLAIGHLGLSEVCGGRTAKPVGCPDVSSLLKIPKETVRRKTGRLVKLDLVSIGQHGVLLENIDEWRRLAESFAE